jgi:hypothetical protein
MTIDAGHLVLGIAAAFLLGLYLGRKPAQRGEHQPAGLLPANPTPPQGPEDFTLNIMVGPKRQEQKTVIATARQGPHHLRVQGDDYHGVIQRSDVIPNEQDKFDKIKKTFGGMIVEFEGGEKDEV